MPKNKNTYHVGNLPVVIQEDEFGGYWVNCPVFEGCYSQGETIDACLKNIKEAIELSLEEIPQKKRKQAISRNVSLHFVSV
ncbi:MAG: type II toxin-antitoxin system HicB family antitoxin [Candidatus Magasanikbacteria bacterium]|nr:type II toxin-antitoxin system HicB family antitoxin [Candidatus Magasanikbacteria bacterium]